MTDPPILRIGARDMRQITIVVRVSGVAKLRLKLALWLVRIAGRIGGFRKVAFVRDSRSDQKG